MGFRFRRSIRLGKGMRINVSKSGLGLSLGRPGATFSIGPRGARSTLSIPGTGMSWVSQSGHGTTSTSYSTVDQDRWASVGRPGTWCVILGVPMLFVLFPVGLAMIVGGLIWNSLGHKGPENLPEGHESPESGRVEEDRPVQRPDVARKTPFDKGVEAFNQGRWSHALTYLKEAQAADPENTQILKLIMLTCVCMGDFIGGEEFLRGLLADKPDSVVFREALGEHLGLWGQKAFEDGNDDLAINLLEEANQLLPGRVATVKTLTLALRRKHEYVKAAICGENWLALEDIPDARAVLGEIYACSSNFDKAIPMLQSAVGTVAEDERVILLGRCFLGKGQLDLAIETLKKGPGNKRKMDPNVMEAKYWLGVAYLKGGQKAKAKSQFAKVYAENVNFREIRRFAAEVGLIEESSHGQDQQDS